jgi:NAD(P)H-hydrate epimerase
MKVLSAKEIRKWDAFTIKTEPLSSINLMERAAAACVKWILNHNFFETTFAIFCGPGNNGGDGLAIARMLLKEGFHVNIFIITSKKYSPNFIINLNRLKKRKACVTELADKSLPPQIENSVVIDAIFGTGLHHPADGIYKKIIGQLNNLGCTIIAIDMPSGLDADNHTKQKEAIVRAQFTLTFQCYKTALLMPENAAFTGEVVLLDIQLNPDFLNIVDSKYAVTDLAQIKTILRPRSAISHKGNFGHALLIAGSKGKIGAALLATKACLRSGAGLTTLFTPACGYSIAQTSIPEAMCLADANENFITSMAELTPYSAIGIGPGIGEHQDTFAALTKAIDAGKSMVLDADALNMLAKNKNWLKRLPHQTILTPHAKEFARLFGKCNSDFDCFKLQLQVSAIYNIVIVFKGRFTRITTPAGECFFNPTGNAGLAKGGSGDVLTGIIAALLAQGYSAKDAAIAGVYLHGLAADLALPKYGTYSLLATDVIKNLGNAFIKITT